MRLLVDLPDGKAGDIVFEDESRASYLVSLNYGALTMDDVSDSPQTELETMSIEPPEQAIEHRRRGRPRKALNA